MVLYAVGIPCVFAWILFRNRVAVKLDQTLYVLGTGDTPSTNEHLSTRRRFNQLYKLFVPMLYYWKLVLLVRKFVIVFVAVMLPAAPMLQSR